MKEESIKFLFILFSIQISLEFKYLEKALAMDGTEDSETFSKPFHLGISRTYLIKVIFVPKYFT